MDESVVTYAGRAHRLGPGGADALVQWYSVVVDWGHPQVVVSEPGRAVIHYPLIRSGDKVSDL